MQGEEKRILKDLSPTGLRFNKTEDFLDFKLSYYLPETKNKIEEVVERFQIELAGILDDDRAKSEEAGLCMTAESEQPCTTESQ